MSRKKKIFWWLFSSRPEKKKSKFAPEKSESESSGKVVIYSAPTCSDSQVAKRFFSEEKIDYVDKNVEKPEIRQELLRTCGILLTPTIIMGKTIFLGFGINIEDILRILDLWKM
jgi:glutaredoxin 3